MTREELEGQIQAQDCELEYWFQQAENYAEVQIPADDLRAIIARTYAAVNALPELLAVKAERDRAQRACEQMGARIASLENLIRAMIENEPDDIVADGGHTVLDEWRYNARAALKETGSFTDDPFNRAVLGLPLEPGQ